jgi:uncharacterized protein HemX
MAPIMSESVLPPSSAPQAPDAPAPGLPPPGLRGPQAARARTAARLAWLAVLLAAVAALLGGLALQRSGDVEQRLERQRTDSQARDQRNAERDRQLEELQRQWAQAQSETDLGAGQMPDANVRRRRETLALIDIERLVEQVQLQLRLGAPPGVAVEALTAADARLGRLSGSGVSRVQAALRHDLARLKALPDLDRGLLAARLDPLFNAVDNWHATADPTHPSERPLAAGGAAAPAAAPGAKSANPDLGADSYGARLRGWISREFGDLLRIREVDTPEALRLGPVQQQLLRDRVRLGILDLREAILTRDERTIRAEENALEGLLTHYFDPGQAEVAAAIAQLRATAASATAGAAPSLDETLGALRAARSGSGA